MALRVPTIPLPSPSLMHTSQSSHSAPSPSLRSGPEIFCHGAASPRLRSADSSYQSGPAPLAPRDSLSSRAMLPSSAGALANAVADSALTSVSAAADVKVLTLASASREAAVNSAAALRVAYQGVPGAYSEMAAKRAYPDCSPVPCNQFDDAFLAVEQWLVDRAVLPIENSLGGSIHRNYDLLLRHRLHIVGEVQLPVHHCLLALPGARIEDLTRVMSHPQVLDQALAQVEMTLSRLGTMTREAVDDTAGAAKMISQGKLKGVGAVASIRAAEIYGLDVLAEGIEDDSDNVTRFLVLAREPVLPQNNVPFKTSIVFTLEEGPGVLFRALAVFALREINLTKIESRPQRDKPFIQQRQSNGGGRGGTVQGLDASLAFVSGGVLGTAGTPSSDENGRAQGIEGEGVSKEESTSGNSSSQAYKMFDYLFYIDFQASLAERNAQNALRHLQEFAPFLRVLGSYPMDTGVH